MDGYCLSPYICKRCTVFNQFDRLNFDGVVGKHQKHQNPPRQNFALYGIVALVAMHLTLTIPECIKYMIITSMQ